MADEQIQESCVAIQKRWTDWCTNCRGFVFSGHKGRGVYVCLACGARMEPVVVIREADLAGTVTALRELYEACLRLAVLTGTMDKPDYFGWELAVDAAREPVRGVWKGYPREETT